MMTFLWGYLFGMILFYVRNTGNMEHLPGENKGCLLVLASFFWWIILPVQVFRSVTRYK